MTKSDWLVCSDIQNMIQCISCVPDGLSLPTAANPFSDRPLRLFAVGCCRAEWAIFTDAEARSAVETAERFADGLATLDDLQAAALTVRQLYHRLYKESIRDGRFEPALNWNRRSASLSAADIACTDVMARIEAQKQQSRTEKRRRLPPWWYYSVSVSYRIQEATREQRNSYHCASDMANLLRCVFGYPFKSVKFDERWRSRDAMELASAIYENRDFKLMPVLGDALEEAQCNNDDVLDHCRGEDPHVRGCWVLEQLLNKNNPFRNS